MVLDWQPCRLRQVARSTARYGRRPREAAADRERLTRRSALLQAGSAAKPAKRTGGTYGVGGGLAGQVIVPLETRPCLGQEVLWVGRSGTRPTTFSRRLCHERCLRCHARRSRESQARPILWSLA